MRKYPDVNDKYDAEDVRDLNAKPWQLDALKWNPDYVWWGPHEDCMITENMWCSPVFFASWSEFSFSLDDLNEVVNFYFHVERESANCEACGGTGYNPETRKISDAFYDFENTGQRWCDRITDDEVDALWERGRLRRFEVKPNAAQVNAVDHIHDAINRTILIKARAKRHGVWGECDVCSSRGYVFTADYAALKLTLWVIHPRKGASRGIEVARIEQRELPEVVAYLRKAAERNANRFGRLPEPVALGGAS